MHTGDVAPAGGPCLRIRLLGPVSLLIDEQPVAAGGPGARAVLALLALKANQVVAQHEIIDALWEHDPPATARTVVHGHVSTLRRCLAAAQGTTHADATAPVRLVTISPGYQLVVDAQRVDVHRARELLDGSAGASPTVRSALLSEALALWRGPALADVGELVPVPELDELRVAVQAGKVDAELELGRYVECIADIEALLRQHPRSERFTAQLMRALYHSGRRSEALEAYYRFSSGLVKELGLEPGPELGALHGRVLADNLDRDDGDPPTRARPVPMQVPPAVPFLAGRAAELGSLDGLLGRAGSERSVVGIVTGTAGVGKSALAVSWAHGVASQFADGVLYAGLRGFDPNHPPRAATDVLAELLPALGVPSSDIPDSLGQRAGLYRSLLAGKRVLLVLDDAHTAEQVWPLLPPAAGAMTVVTSRSRLDGLAVSSAARLVALGPLDSSEAVRVITGPADTDGASDGTASVLARLCGYLPLALRIVGARVSAGPPGAAGRLIAALEDERTRLATLELDEVAGVGAPIGMRAALDVSFADLADSESEMLRTIGAFPGWVIRPCLAAVLCGLEVGEARRRLRVLAGQNLLSEYAQDEFVTHDLVRAYLVDMADAAHASSRRTVVRRALEYYLAVGDTARRSLGPVVDGIDTRARVPATVQPAVGGFGAALDWFSAEWPNLVATLQSAMGMGTDDDSWQLARVAHAYRVNRPLWDDWIHLVTMGTDAATRVADPRAAFWMLISRSAARLVFERISGVLVDTERALAIATELGEPSLEVTARIHHGCALTSLNRHDDALAAQRDALAGAEELGLGLGETLRSQALHNYAEAQKRAGRYTEAIEFQRRAFDVYTRNGQHGDVIRGLANLAEMQLYAGELTQAQRAAVQTVELALERGFTLQEGVGRLILARVLRARGQLEPARAELETALELHARVGDARVGELRSELARLSVQPV